MKETSVFQRIFFIVIMINSLLAWIVREANWAHLYITDRETVVAHPKRGKEDGVKSMRSLW
jgi:hypothetical protein